MSDSQSKAKDPAFVDIAESAGLKYSWAIPGKRPINILQSIGNGCAFLDYDGDGNLDILLVGSHPALFRGNGHGKFTDVSIAAGLGALAGHFLGCAVGDYDNDGWPDVYLSGYGCGKLLHNDHGRRFVDVTANSGIVAQPWGSSCTFFDVDGDGKLDLYVGNYVKFGPASKQLCTFHGFATACGPGEYEAERGVLYRNVGDSKFNDSTREFGFAKASGKALGVAAGPLRRDRSNTLAIANDNMTGDLFARSIGSKSYTNIGIETGMALAGDSNLYGGMGIDWGDFNNDGNLDLTISTYQNQAKPIFENLDGRFTILDTARVGMMSCVPWVAFGVKWIDFDNDGWLDLIMSNGHVQDNIKDVNIIGSVGAVFRQSTVLFRNLEGLTFEDQSNRLSGGGDKPIVGRGLAIGDFDNDGKLDALVVDCDGKPLLLHNVAPAAGNYLLVDLIGQTCNRDGYGAVVTVKAGGQTLVRHCHADGSYLSSSDKRVHFGLGKSQSVDRMEIRWPDGKTDVRTNVKVNSILKVRQSN